MNVCKFFGNWISKILVGIWVIGVIFGLVSRS